MDNIAIIQEITNAFVENRHDQEVLDKYFATNFEHIVNGQRSDLSGYADHLSRYTRNYRSLSIPKWDELFAVDDKVVVSYVLEGETKDGTKENIAVMAIWRLKDGKVVALREVDARL